MLPNTPNHQCAGSAEEKYLLSRGVITLPTMDLSNQFAVDVSDDLAMSDEDEEKFPIPGPDIITRPTIPGRKCPKCAAAGQTVWVIPGKSCPKCYNPVW